MNSLEKLLQFIVDNWSQIIVILTLILTIYNRGKKFIEDWNKKTEEEKKEELNKAVESAKKSLSQYILILVSDAELDWQSFDGKLGQMKRAQVIEKIYEKYPILEQVEDKDALLKEIDKMIEKSLEIVREELKKND